MSEDEQPVATVVETTADKKMRDIDTDLYLKLREYPREELMSERKVVLRKLDCILMPLVSFHAFSVQRATKSLGPASFGHLL
jgi:hypothetical protein